MEVESDQSTFFAAPAYETSPRLTEHAPFSAEEFDESQCLFCSQPNSDLEKNLTHMSKTHGLHIDPRNLLVDFSSLLAYFQLVIFECHECLYCGTQRNNRQAVQQHMMDKGHCKYDISNKDSELREFYDLPTLEIEEDGHRKLGARRFFEECRPSGQARSRNPRSSTALRKQRPPPRSTASSLNHAMSASDTDAAPGSNSSETPLRASLELSTRALKQEVRLSNQVANLRADDRRSLSHLPSSQQRAVLATYHKQMEKASRTEQTQRTNLDSAGNHFSRLSTIRLIRKPPHTGNLFSLSR